MPSQNNQFTIDSLRGGMNNQDPSNAIADDQCVLAENVEFFQSTLGERRAGMEAVDIDASGLDSEHAIVHLNIHFPKNVEVKDAELFAVGSTATTSLTWAIRASDKSSWLNITPIDTPEKSWPIALKIRSQSLHNKLFVGFKSNKDRTHVWDGTTFRRVGLLAPTGTPTAIDTGSGAFADDRTYRLRVIIKDSDGKILLRSEPTSEVTLSPSGTGGGALVDWSAVVVPNESETHWELEASDGDGNFYIIAVLPIATTSYTDTTSPATDYAANELSFEIGEYDVPGSYKFLKADQDRMIFASSWEDEEKGSRIAWTPVWKDPGVGNDERIPADTDNFLDLDWMDGGDLTALSDPLNGAFYAFKWTRIYRVQRTGRFDSAYQAYLLSAAHGAVDGSVVSGMDEYGRACVYFIDPSSGPMRISSSGVQYLNDIRGTWRRINMSAANVVCHGVYYPDKQQVHWWVAVDGADSPNYKVILQVNQIRSDTEATHRGWTVATGDITSALCSTVVPELITDEDTGSNILGFIPYAGFIDPNFVQRCDIGTTDNGTIYYAKIITKPYIVSGLINKWGAMAAGLLAEPLNDGGASTIDVKLIRDFGKEVNYINTNFVPEGAETSVIKFFDNLFMSNSAAIQIQFSDPGAP